MDQITARHLGNDTIYVAKPRPELRWFEVVEAAFGPDQACEALRSALGHIFYKCSSWEGIMHAVNKDRAGVVKALQSRVGEVGMTCPGTDGLASSEIVDANVLVLKGRHDGPAPPAEPIGWFNQFCHGGRITHHYDKCARAGWETNTIRIERQLPWLPVPNAHDLQLDIALEAVLDGQTEREETYIMRIDQTHECTRCWPNWQAKWESELVLLCVRKQFPLDLVVTLCPIVCPESNLLTITCTDLSGQQISLLNLAKQSTVAELRAKLTATLHAKLAATPDGQMLQLKLLLVDGRLIEKSSDAMALQEALLRDGAE